MTVERPLQSAHVFCGESNHNVSLVYCALATEIPDSAIMRGTLRGPQSRFTHTLPARVDVQFLGAQPTPLARATVVDPCYWAPGEPFLYDLELELTVSGRVVDRLQRVVGLRPTGVMGHALRLSLRPWFVRGVRVRPAALEEPVRWRELKLAQIWSDIREEAYRLASEEGIPIILQAGGNPEELRSAIRQCCGWPSCVLAILDSSQPLDASLQKLAPNLLVAQRLRSPTAPLDRWAHVGVCDMSPGDDWSGLPVDHFPLIVSSTTALYDDLTEAVVRIEQCQAEAEAHRSIAGVMV